MTENEDQSPDFNQRLETDNFVLRIERQHQRDGEDEVRAAIHAIYNHSDNDPYYDDAKMTSRGISGYAKDALMGNGLDPDENGDLKKEIQMALTEAKSDIRELAKKRKEYFDDRKSNIMGKLDEEDDTEETIIEEVIKRIYQAEDPTLEDFDDVEKFDKLLEANTDMILVKNVNHLSLTKKGTARAEEILGVDKIEDLDKRTDEVLEENPLQFFLEQIDRIHKGDEELKIWELVSALSAACSDRQIHSWAVGPSGAGKSHIKRSIVKFLPDAAYENPNSMTPKAMLYKTDSDGTDCFKNKLLFLDEADGYDDPDAVVLLRGLTDPDEDNFVHQMVRDQEYEELIIEGPVTVWFTSVESINDEQLKNRFILTNPDGSEELDEIVFEHQQKNLHKGKEPSKAPAEAEIIRNMLQEVRIETSGLTPIIPFEVEWKQKFNRRLYPYFVTLMEVIAKINYKNRVIKDEYIYVTRADFRTAAVVWSSLIDTTIAQTDVEALKLIMALPDENRNAARTSELAQNLEGFNTDKVRRKAEGLRDTEELQLINANKEGGQWEYWAGNDRELLINPEPELLASPDKVKESLKNHEIGFDEEILESVMQSDVAVYEDLKEKQKKLKKQKLDEVNEWDIELTKEEQKMLRLLEDMNFSTDLGFVVNSSQMSEDDAWDMLNTLEHKGVLKLYEDDKGNTKADKTRTYEKARSEGRIDL